MTLIKFVTKFAKGLIVAMTILFCPRHIDLAMCPYLSLSVTILSISRSHYSWLKVFSLVMRFVWCVLGAESGYQYTPLLTYQSPSL